MTNLNNKYRSMLVDVYQNGEVRTPRGIEVKELRPYIFTLEDSTENVITLPGLETNLNYANEELEWYVSGNPNINYSPRIERVWKQFSDDGVRVNSNYGERIWGKHPILNVDQFTWVSNLLKRDPDSRQAVININSYFDKAKPTKDFPCTLDIQYFVNKDSLDSIVHMRSNDAYLGFRNDLFTFTEIQKMLAMTLGVKPGKYTHIANSMHLYSSDYERARRLL